MKKAWEIESSYHGDDISMLPGADLLDLLIEDHFTINILKPKVSYYAKKAVRPVSPPVIEDEVDSEITAINQSAAAILARISEESSSSPVSRTKSPPMLIPRKNTLSPRTISPLVIPAVIAIVGSPEQNPLPSDFITLPIEPMPSVQISTVKPTSIIRDTPRPVAAETRKSKRPITFRGNSASSLVSLYTTPATTPTSTELLAEEAGSFKRLVPGLSL